MKRKILALGAWMSVVVGLASVAQGEYLTVYGSPGYDPNTGNGLQGYMPERGKKMVNDSGTAVGYADKYVGGTRAGQRAVRWDGSGAAGTELEGLGVDPNGYTSYKARAINTSGMIVGDALKHSVGWRAVRWDASGTITELDSVGTNASGYYAVSAVAVNDAGTAVGWAVKQGYRTVRWDADGAITELGNLGTKPDGSTGGGWDPMINASGTVVNSITKYVDGNDQGYRAVRWEAGGTAATELGNLGTDPNGITDVWARAINGVGTAVGHATKYDSGIGVGSCAVRWDAGGTAATELGNPLTDPNGTVTADALAINDSGTAVGYARTYVIGTGVGYRAVRWDAGGTAATELGNLGTDPNGVTNAMGYAINTFGTAVGYAVKYVNGSSVGYRAVAWGLDGSAVDLNDLIDPNGGWTLADALYISDTGWIVGNGHYDPDGAGGFDAYDRPYLLQIPEPGTLLLLGLGTLGMLRRRR